MPASSKLNFTGGTHESTTETRERKKNRTRRLCRKSVLPPAKESGKRWLLAFALASHAFAAEPKKEEPIDSAAGGGARSEQPLHRAAILAVEISRAAARHTAIDHHRAEKSSSRSRAAPPCATHCATSPASASRPAKAAAPRATASRCAASTRATTCIIDGVRDQGTYFRDAFNLESVEVLKGPSSTYFRSRLHRRHHQSGEQDAAVSIPSTSGTFSGGSGLYFRGTADINQPLWLPRSALRVNLMAHRADIVERDVVEATAPGIRAVAHPWPRHADPVDLELSFSTRGQYSGLRFSLFPR